MVLRSINDCISSFLTSTYISFMFLLIFGTMWMYDVRFDTRFFAIAYSLLGHIELLFMEWSTDAIRNLAKYFTAAIRIEVIVTSSSLPHLTSSIQTFLRLGESERDHRLLSVTDQHTPVVYQPHITNSTPSARHLASVECHLKRAHWQQVPLSTSCASIFILASLRTRRSRSPTSTSTPVPAISSASSDPSAPARFAYPSLSISISISSIE